MDMQIGIFCGLFSIIASLIVYAVLSFYSIKEDSFDEAKANRRKLLGKEYSDQRSNAEKTKLKKPKKTAKKIKDKKIEQSESEKKIEGSAAVEVPNETFQVESVEEPKKIEVPVKPISKKKSQPIDKEKEDKTSTVASTPVPVAENPKKVSISIAENPKKVSVPIAENPKKVSIPIAENPKKASDKKGNQKTQEKKVDPEKAEPPQSSCAAPLKEPEKKSKIDVKPEKKKVENLASSSTLRKQSSGSEKQHINVNSVLTVIQKAELSRSEVQLLIDTLLNSEDETSDWLKVKKLDSGQKDNSAKLKKQLSEYELALKNEKQITSSLQNKLKELRTELAVDKANVTHFKEAVSKLQQEKDDLIYEKSDLTYKLKASNDDKHELQEELNKELVKLQQQQKLDDDHINEAMSLRDENNALISRVAAVESENVSLKSSISCLEEELNMHQNYHEKINGLEQAYNILSEKVNEKESELSSSRKQIESLLTTVNKFKKENNDLKIENQSLSIKVTESGKEVGQLKLELVSLSEKLCNLENEEQVKENGNELIDSNPTNYQQMLEEKENSLNSMAKQIESYTKCLSELKLDLSKSNEENDKLKSMLNQANSELLELKENIKNLKTHKSESELLITSLKNNVNDYTAEIALLKHEIEKNNQKNNLQCDETLNKKFVNKETGMEGRGCKSDTNGINSTNDSMKLMLEEKDTHLKQMSQQIDNNTKIIIDLKSELRENNEENSNLRTLLNKANTELADLKDNLNRLKIRNTECEDVIANLRNNVNDKNGEIVLLKEEVEKYKERNNELRNKNWKVVQALTEAEKALQNKLKAEEHDNGNNHNNIEELKNNVNTFIRRLFPEIDIQEYKGHFDDWLRSVENTVSLEKAKNNQNELQSQNTHLQSLVVNYKRIISDTENMLNELQNHIEVEESKWKDKFISYEKEIETLRASFRPS